MAANNYDDPFGDEFAPPLDAYEGDDMSRPPEVDRPYAGEQGSDDSGGFDLDAWANAAPPTPVDSPEAAREAEAEAAFKAREEERRKERESLYGRLNERQALAVNSPAESALVLAGAGSGKTSVLTARVARLVSTGEAPARAVLAVTFTNKAAMEMKHRLSKLLDRRSVNELWMGTFHSLCNKLLRENYAEAGLPKAFAILDTDGQEALCRGILKDFGLTKAAVKDAAKVKAASAQSGLGSADPLAAAGGLRADDVEEDGLESQFVTPAQCAKYISARKEQLQPPAPPAGLITTLSTDVDQMEAVYAEYEIRARKQGLLDFQDLLVRGVELLEKNPEVRQKYQDRFTTILVDEFQDTNDIQYRWIELLKGPRAHVMAVGDDSQSIYAFRGANPANMTKFVNEMTTSKAHPQGKIIKLEQNYRSLPHILEAANAIIDRNPNQLKKTLFTSQPDRKEKIELITFGNAVAEASSIAESIHRMLKEQKVPASEIAVLYRTNQQSRLLEQELNKRGTPLTVYGGFRFYERQEVKHVLAYLDLICDLSRDISFGRVVNFPPRGIGERTVEELRQDAQSNRKSMMETVSERSVKMEQNPASIGNAAAQKKQRQLEGFAQVVLDLADEAVTLKLSELIERVMDHTGMQRHYLEEAGGSKSSQTEVEERLANIAELVSAARQFEIDNPELSTAAEQLPEYLSYVALMTSTSESDMSKKNTVSLMTVHSSKGLEFDHVFIAGLEESTFPHSRAIKEDEERGNNMSVDQAIRLMTGNGDDDEDEADDLGAEVDGEGMQEERRLMYVAVTRARKTLVLTHAEERLLNGEPKAAPPSRFLLEIPEHRLRRVTDARGRFGDKKRPTLNSVQGGFRGSNGNREYGGDGFDEGRDEFKPAAPKRFSKSEPAQPGKQVQQSFPAADMATAPGLEAAGSIRVISKRRGGVVEAEDEVVIDVDRSHPSLGNRHFLKDFNDDDERNRVVEAFEADLTEDLQRSGPMTQAIKELAARVASGERIALRCWCAPKKCHADKIAAEVFKNAKSLLSTPATPAASEPVAAAPAMSPSPAPAAPVAEEAPHQADEKSAQPEPVKPAPVIPNWRRRPGRQAEATGPSETQKQRLSVVAGGAIAPDNGTSIAIIGTAGRDKDQPMTRRLWERMLDDARSRVQKGDTLVSGGAAWADHLAVALFLEGHVNSLTLHLPAPFVKGRYVGAERESAASAANYYHRRFTELTGVDGLKQIGEAIAKGATITEQPEGVGYSAMFARNKLVAASCQAVIAYTFGAGSEPADGGTKNTWSQITGKRTHVPLLPMCNQALVEAAATKPGVAPPPADTFSRLRFLKRKPG